jgi:hypothetical protein
MPTTTASVVQTASGSSRLVRLRLPRAPQNGMLRVPLLIDAGDPYNALDLTVDYSGDGFQPLRVRKMRGADGAVMVANLNEPGRIRIALASAEPISPGGLLIIDFTVSDNPSVQIVRADVE